MEDQRSRDFRDGVLDVRGLLRRFMGGWAKPAAKPAPERLTLPGKTGKHAGGHIHIHDQTHNRRRAARARRIKMQKASRKANRR